MTEIELFVYDVEAGQSYLRVRSCAMASENYDVSVYPCYNKLLRNMLDVLALI